MISAWGVIILYLGITLFPEWDYPCIMTAVIGNILLFQKSGKGACSSEHQSHRGKLYFNPTTTKAILNIVNKSKEQIWF